MIIAIPKEISPYEHRVAITPDTTKKFIKLGFQIKIEDNAGEKAGFSNQEYIHAGAEICATAQQTYAQANIILKINSPLTSEDKFLTPDMTIIANFQALNNKERIKTFAKLGTQCFALDLIPRISRAQPMDILSSQNNLAGYRAVIETLNHFNQAVPLMMTSAGTIPPAKILILGVGVAGLQAIATAKRLGAQVYATDIRPETKEQVESLGATFVEKLTPEFLHKINIIISTVTVAGQKAPILLTDSQLQYLPQNSVILDMAVDSGGNIEGSIANQTIIKHGIIIIGNSHLESLIPTSASNLFANNIYNFIVLGFDSKNQQLSFNLQDEIFLKTCICQNGEIL